MGRVGVWATIEVTGCVSLRNTGRIGVWVMGLVNIFSKTVFMSPKKKSPIVN